MTTDPYMDPLDERLRQAMKALDDQVSDRYFEELPNRTLARLEEMMQSDVNRPRAGAGQTPLPSITAATPPREQGEPAKPERQEDSGLHDIRALAQTTKQRMSQRRIPTQNPPVDTSVSVSSASLRAVALPEPGKMVALTEAPTVGNGTGPAPAIEPDRKSAKKIEQAAAVAAAAPATAMASPITPMRPRSKAPMIVTGSLVVAAAAGVVGYMVLQKNDAAAPTASSAPRAEQEKAAAAPAREATVAAPAPAMAPASDNLEINGKADTGAAGSGVASGAAALMATDGTATTEGDVEDAKTARGKGEHERADHDKDKDKGSGSGHKKIDDKKPGGGTEDKAPPADPTKKLGPADKQEQSLDDLLRGAGVDPDASKKKDAPKLDKKGLDAGDIRTAMSALNGKAQGCYGKFNVSGSVAVKLTVAPSGEVKKAAVTGSFAGTPTGDCVAAIAKGAKFPAWDGATMTVNYSYFLSE